jgi:hypothetical protein
MERAEQEVALICSCYVLRGGNNEPELELNLLKGKIVTSPRPGYGRRRY